MKTIHSALVVTLTFVTGTALATAHDPQQHSDKTARSTPQSGQMDHSKMKTMDHSAMRAEHAKMAGAEFAKLDKNKDGKIAKSETPAKSPLASHFDMLDTNKNGSLSQVEFAEHHKM